MRLLGFCIIFSACMACAFAQNLPKNTWKIAGVDSEEKNEEVRGSGPASCLIDNNVNTFWTTAYKTQHTPFPHYAVIDLGGTVKLSGFTFYPRQKRYVGKIGGYKIHISTDNRQWKLIHEGTFKWKNRYDFSPIQLNLKNTTYTARFVKFEILNTAITTKFDKCAHLAEMDVQGMYLTPYLLPRIHVQKDTVLKGEAAHFADSSFVQGTQIRSREWHFPGGNPAISNEANPEVHYTVYGKHSAVLTITSREGIKKTISLPGAVTYLPAAQLQRSNWKVVVSDQEVTSANDTATNMIDGDIYTKWHTTWYYGKKLPHFIIINLKQKTKISAIGYLPRQAGSVNGIFSSYKIYISNDSINFGEAICHVTEPKPYRALRYIEFPPRKGQYLKIVIDKSFPLGKDFASASELYIYGEAKSDSFTVWIISGVVMALALLLIGLYYYKLKKKKSQEEVLPKVEMEPLSNETVKIFLFGKFQITNEGREVEQLFNKLKQILAVITYHTIENLGITTAELSRLLWAGLPEENVASARSSNIKKLRTALESVPSVQIVIEKKLWQLHSPDNNVFVDFESYRKFSDMLTNTIKSNQLNEALINNYLTIIERGRFLEDFETEWADDLKNKISEEIIDLIRKLISSHSDKLSKKMKVRMSDCLFLQDELNVDALRIKLQLYHEESNLGLAKKLYDTYSRKYKLIYKEDFPTDFMEFMQEG